jgi:hypothetical protein
MFLFLKLLKYKILRKFKAGLNIDVLYEIDKYYSNIALFLIILKRLIILIKVYNLKKKTRQRYN